jgi:hypothetical protein
MIAPVAALLLLVLMAAAVTVVDAARAPHWRGVADERRRTWHERAQERPHSAG